MAIGFFNPADQAIYDSGLSFIPQSQFRLADPRMLTPGGIADTDVAANTMPPPIFFRPPVDRDGDGFIDDDDEIDRSNNAGINSFSDLTGYVSTPGIVGGLIGGIPGALLGRTLGQAFNNFNNPYTDIFGRLNKKTKTAIEKDYRNSPEGRAAISAFADIQNQIGRARHGQEGSGGGPGSGANEGGSGADSGSGTHSDPGD